VDFVKGFLAHSSLINMNANAFKPVNRQSSARETLV